MTAYELAQSLQKVNVKAISVATLKEMEAFFTMDIINQLKHGKNAVGKQIGKYRNKYYARKKYQENPLAGYENVDLILTGEFSNSIKIEYDNESMTFDAIGKDKPQGDLTILYERNGPVLGVNPESISEEADTICDIFQRKFNEALK